MDVSIHNVTKSVSILLHDIIALLDAMSCEKII